jgi:hypothetical protein
MGYSHELVRHKGEPYLERWILWLGKLGTVRLHRFWSGDNGPLHDHPFSFITIPFRSYVETTVGLNGQHVTQIVKAWRAHYRPATYVHSVEHPVRPFFTLCFTSGYQRKWGFITKDGWIPYDKLTAYDR